MRKDREPSQNNISVALNGALLKMSIVVLGPPTWAARSLYAESFSEAFLGEKPRILQWANQPWRRPDPRVIVPPVNRKSHMSIFLAAGKSRLG